MLAEKKKKKKKKGKGPKYEDSMGYLCFSLVFFIHSSLHSTNEDDNSKAGLFIANLSTKTPDQGQARQKTTRMRIQITERYEMSSSKREKDDKKPRVHFPIFRTGTGRSFYMRETLNQENTGTCEEKVNLKKLFNWRYGGELLHKKKRERGKECF
jgi:hypothetical protein